MSDMVSAQIYRDLALSKGLEWIGYSKPGTSNVVQPDVPSTKMATTKWKHSKCGKEFWASYETVERHGCIKCWGQDVVSAINHNRIYPRYTEDSET
jgi:hypothetical protein